MAMLAEKRQRTKWCLNPMGNAWAKDENKFGQRMLEKMGWEPGTGLGARGQGRTEIIKMNIKSDTRGLGCAVKDHSDNWKEQLESFDNLLAQLNGSSKSSEDENLALPSLEEKSKASRARVHYHKFTRGKDLSKYSPKDLKCILPLSIKEKNEMESINNQNNMYEYFKNKNKDSQKTEEEAKKSDSLEHLHENQIHPEDEEVEPIIRKDKKKKKKRKNLDHIENEDSLNTSFKKKKKSKLSESNALEDLEVDNDRILNEENEDLLDKDQICVSLMQDSDVPHKKSKKKKNKKHCKYPDNKSEVSEH